MSTYLQDAGICVIAAATSGTDHCKAPNPAEHLTQMWDNWATP
jgi:hypothetical protein